VNTQTKVFFGVLAVIALFTSGKDAFLGILNVIRAESIAYKALAKGFLEAFGVQAGTADALILLTFAAGTVLVISRFAKRF